MKSLLRLTLIFMFLTWITQFSFAAEHGGKEHAGKEQAGKEQGGKAVKAAAKEPSKEDIQTAMRAYVDKQAAQAGGYFEVYDPDIGQTRRLSLLRVHERVGKTGGYYYSCADFKDIGSEEMLDLDLDVQDKNGVLSVVDVRIHKIEGEPRYTYDEKDNRIPLEGK